MSRSLAALVVSTASLLAGGCGGSRPAEELETALGELAGGRLSSAYARLLPPSYARDLDALFQRAKRLITREELSRLDEILRNAGGRIASELERKNGDAAVEALAAKLRDPLASMGIDGYEAWLEADLGAVIRGLEGLCAALLECPSVRERLGTVRFRELEREGDRAVVRITYADPDGNERTADAHLRRIEGMWFPADVADDWAWDIARIRRSIDRLIARKEEHPDEFARFLDRLELGAPGVALLVQALR